MTVNEWLELPRDGLHWRRWGNLVTEEKWRGLTSPIRIRAPGAFGGTAPPEKVRGWGRISIKSRVEIMKSVFEILLLHRGQVGFRAHYARMGRSRRIRTLGFARNTECAGRRTQE